uniref:Methyltransferase n=1 Tax=viral metagenome TaxID=1070528 RepID=A0A6C0KBS4_9ZZZZ
MNSSYTNTIDFGDIISTVTFLKKPRLIVECGILEGYSLSKFIDNSHPDTIIHAYDIFDEFNGNHAVKQNLQEKFSRHPNVEINYGDFYHTYKKYENKSIDILHIDIANNGEVYDFMFHNYIDKVKDDGYILMEGGSISRDNIEWMSKYNKPKIQPILKKYTPEYNIKTIGNIPSITIINKK